MGMMGDPPESTSFFNKRPKDHANATKRQEAAVGKMFAEGYESLTGTRLTGLRPAEQDPPDLLFDCNNVVVGAELFEVGWHYEGGAFFDKLTNLIYAEFHKRDLEERFLGVVINLGTILGVDFRERRQEGWEGGVRKLELQAATELVDLASESGPSRDGIPEANGGTFVKVDEERFPALRVLTTTVMFNKCDPNDERRSDGKASPVVIANAVTTYTDAEMINIATEKMRKKEKRKLTAKRLWNSVDHSILIAHDLPRRHVYTGFGVRWEEWLRTAAEQSNILEYFDEFWLVQALSKPLAVRICGRALGE